MNILIYGPFSFPNGTGATARMHAYGNSLVSMGCTVNLFCVEPTEFRSSMQNFDIFGNVNGIDFRYTCGTTVANSSFFRRKLDAIKGIYGLFSGIIRENRTKKIDVIIYYTAKSTIHTIVGWLASRLCGIVFYAETTEYPFIYERNSIRKRLKSIIYEAFTCKLFDGMFVISTCLEQYYRKVLKSTSCILRIPIVVDLDKFIQSSKEIDTRIICYCGNLSILQELDNLMSIFLVISSIHEDVRLKIIGNLEKSPFRERFYDIVRVNNLQNRIIVTGAIAQKDIAIEFSTADVFVLPRPSGLFSSAGFPTKLGEYLATGKPVITTNTGDISLYLTHKHDAYLVEPDNNEAFAAELNHVLSNPDEARIVGNHGRMTCLKHFDANINAALIVEHFRKYIQYPGGIA